MKKKIEPKVFAFIFVRAGSKRLKNKNILKFNNKPLFMNSVEQAKKIKEISRIFVSSDSPKIISICKKNNVEFIKRPKKYATSNSKEILSWKHATEYTTKKYKDFDYFLSLPATNPLRKQSDIKKIIIKCKSSKEDKIFITISKLKNNIIDNLVTKKNDTLSLLKQNIIQKKISKKIYQINGSVYMVKKNLINKIKKDIFDLKVSSIETNPSNSIDIDDISDFKIAKSLLKKR